MCGVFGVLYFDKLDSPDATPLRRSGDLIAHRGPDNTSFHSEPGLGLVHTRLSLIDLSERSNQPFWDASGRYCLVYNGEIYNFESLRADLERKGRTFRTTSDTEVLLEGLICEDPTAFCRKLDGMFAFAFWDRQTRTMLIGRDRFGMKPMVIHQDAERVLFGSEVKAFKPWMPLAPNLAMVCAQAAGFGGPTRDTSLFKGVRILAPGSLMQIQAGGVRNTGATEMSDLPGLRLENGNRIRTWRFFSMHDFVDPDYADDLARLGPNQAVDRLDELLNASVERHLIADTAVGALCSGGVDSSLILAIAARSHSDLSIFHANVTGPLSELEEARALSRHLGLKLDVIDVDDTAFCSRVTETLNAYEFPFLYHPSSIPFGQVAKLVRRSGVKAVLSGEGSDEAFLGYNAVAYQDLRGAYRRKLARMRRLVQRVPLFGRGIWPDPVPDRPHGRDILARFETALDDAEAAADLRRRGLDPSSREYRSLHWLNYHLRTLLHRNDALGMAASIEARFPLLDTEVIRFAVNLPYRYKIRPEMHLDRSHPFLTDKWVLRQLADRYVPKTLSRKRKAGFLTSAHRQVQARPDFYRDSFVSEVFDLRPQEIERMIETGEMHQATLIQIELWGRLFFRDIPIETVDEVANRDLYLAAA